MWDGNASIGFLEFKPSKIAAVVALSSLVETQIVDIDKAVITCIYVNKVILVHHNFFIYLLF